MTIVTHKMFSFFLLKLSTWYLLRTAAQFANGLVLMLQWNTEGFLSNDVMFVITKKSIGAYYLYFLLNFLNPAIQNT